jgi:hypothetical protein
MIDKMTRVSICISLPIISLTKQDSVILTSLKGENTVEDFNYKNRK